MTINARSVGVRLATTTEKKFIKVRVYFNKGFYLSVGPVEFDGTFETVVLYSARAELIEPAARFNAKRLQQLAEGVLTSEPYKRLLAEILQQTGLVLAKAA